ncbi:hypothetical protein PGT21_028143 [Puccinia graminis f. sp. tritici]|uniref:Uncharacterized protein n=2 Tax=Puccinia graminis f. sp. tritici TaxID=56615 RepID=E3KQ93_PUCGT|nr:uncharacterized protein PGTG_12424 [Puccinia graminis f. sp. tritici CRL 75-36-700-3]EFP86468.2 hypothetical protein PGTG_12424 [Puccinia graminis f. sp. tritici CRL 75-36-700-3]KAA1113325.1 hypothetical protein PGT21_028143 [Puccinia graminis f. sp. tritici]KAA1132539.1 hypothetical protein PGTUg99_014647 [Puccinia graminis f. sp. tritici]
MGEPIATFGCYPPPFHQINKLNIFSEPIFLFLDRYDKANDILNILKLWRDWLSYYKDRLSRMAKLIKTNSLSIYQHSTPNTTRCINRKLREECRPRACLIGCIAFICRFILCWTSRSSLK